MTKEKYIDVKKYRKGVKENHQRIVDYLQKNVWTMHRFSLN